MDSRAVGHSCKHTDSHSQWPISCIQCTTLINTSTKLKSTDGDIIIKSLTAHCDSRIQLATLLRHVLSATPSRKDTSVTTRFNIITVGHAVIVLAHSLTRLDNSSNSSSKRITTECVAQQRLQSAIQFAPGIAPLSAYSAVHPQHKYRRISAESKHVYSSILTVAQKQQRSSSSTCICHSKVSTRSIARL